MIAVFEASVPAIGLWGVEMAEEKNATGAPAPGHAHDGLANWLWDDGSCILWDNNTAIAI